jgi:hypothetical protein
MGDVEEKRVRLALERAVKRRGRIVAPLPLEAPQLVWITRAGEISEIVRAVDAQGAFTYAKPHAEGETLSFTAAGQPLFVMAQPSLGDDEELVVRLPSAPRRTFAVTLAAESGEGGFLALRVGDLLVTVNVLSWHLERRRQQASLEPGHSVIVADILQTGPIRVVFVPFSLMARHPRIQLPMLPELGGLAQQELGARDAITFGAQTPRATAAPRAWPSFR